MINIRLCRAILIALALLTTPSAAIEYRMAHAQGNLRMPPVEMQRKIHALMKAGKAPGYAVVPLDKVKWACAAERAKHEVWGCYNEAPVVVLTFGKRIVIWDGLRGADRHYVLVHEMAHYLFNWRH